MRNKDPRDSLTGRSLANRDDRNRYAFRGVVMAEKVQIKLAFEHDYASRVLPWLKSALMVSTYAAVFRMALNTLLLVVRVQKQGHQLIEVDSLGRSVGVVRIAELEAQLIEESAPCEEAANLTKVGQNNPTPAAP